MVRVAGSLHSRQSGSPEGSCVGGAIWHFRSSSTNLASRLAYLNCIPAAWGAYICMFHSSRQLQSYEELDVLDHLLVVFLRELQAHNCLENTEKAHKI